MVSVLSSEQIEMYHRDGFLTFPDFFDNIKHAQLLEWVEEVSQWEDPELCVHHRELTESGPVLARTEQFLSSHSGLRELLTTGKLISAISQLFGEPACLFKEKINYKHPGGGGFAPHQDSAAYHRFGSEHITCLVAIDANTVENGCLWFAPGHHRDGMLPMNDVGCLSSNDADQMPWGAAPLEPGGVLFFSSFVPHQSAVNDSQISRRSLYVTYSKVREGNLRDAYYQDRTQVMHEHSEEESRASRISTIGHFQGKVVE